MRLRFTSNLLAAMLAIALSSGVAQDQQPSKDQTPANTPQNSAPQTTPQTPPRSDTQTGAPPQNPPSQTPQSDESAPSNQNVPATQEQSPPQQEAQPPQQAAPKANTPAQSKSTHRPKPTTATSPGLSGKVVVRNGGARDDVIHLSPGGSREQEAHNRENTDQLLATTDENLKMLASRQLSPSQQSTVDQIHSYMRQAKSAADSGDLARAHTLAFKAHLLSDDLAKH